MGDDDDKNSKNKKNRLKLFKKSSGPFSSYSESGNFEDQINIELGTAIKRFDSESSGDNNILGSVEMSRFKQNPVLGKARKKAAAPLKLMKESAIGRKSGGDDAPAGFARQMSNTEAEALGPPPMPTFFTSPPVDGEKDDFEGFNPSWGGKGDRY